MISFQLNRWRDTVRSEVKELNPSYLGNNFRPVKSLNKRALRTNINFKTKVKSYTLPQNLWLMRVIDRKRKQTGCSIKSCINLVFGYVLYGWPSKRNMIPLQGSSCPTMYKEMYYKANPWRKSNKLQGDSPNKRFNPLDSPAASSIFIDKMDL